MSIDYVFYNAGGNENIARFTENGAVELYHDNTKRLETLSNGVRVINQLYNSESVINLEKPGCHHHRIIGNDTGNDLGFQQSSDLGSNTNFTTYLRINDGGNISLPVDNQKLRICAGADLQLYHDGSNSRIHDAGTGVLAISGDEVDIQNAAQSENCAKFIQNAQVELYYDNSKKFETISSGASITGFLGIGTNNPAEFLQIYKYRSYNNDADMYMCLGTNDDAVNNNAVYKWRHGITGQAYGYNYIWETLAHTQSSYVERMRLHKDGRLGIGSDSIIDSENRLTVKNDTASKVAHFHHNHDSQRSCIDCTNGHATGGQSAIMIEFRRADGGSVGGIFASTSAAQYNTASDYRLKENQVAISDGITRLKELKPYKFNFKENKDKIVDGFFAHEVSSVVPEAITGTKDEVDENNDPIYQGIDQSKLVPLLVAAVQELIGRVEKLEGA